MADFSGMCGMSYMCEICQKIFEVLDQFIGHDCAGDSTSNSRPNTSSSTSEISQNDSLASFQQNYELVSQLPVEEPNSETSNDGSNMPNRSAWSDGATMCLIDLYKAHAGKFRDVKYKKKEIWKIISGELREKGFSYTPTQTEGRWKTLTASYRRVVDNNNTSGRGRQTCPFFSQLEDVYGFKPNVKPKVLLQTEKSVNSSTPSQCPPVPSTSKSSAAVDIDSSDPSEEPTSVHDLKSCTANKRKRKNY